MKNDKQNCTICENELVLTWTDYHGEAICISCNANYQVYQYDEERNRIDAPPKLKIFDVYVPWAKRYWEEKKRPMGLGSYLGRHPSPEDHSAFFDWMDEHCTEEDYLKQNAATAAGGDYA